jgi:glutamate formiminotransferase
MNIEDWQSSPPHAVVSRIREEAGRRGVEVDGIELVGLIPAGAAVGLDVDPSRVLELRMAG